MMRIFKNQEWLLCWKTKHLKFFKSSENSVIDAHNSHHGSSVYHSSFGNKANYKMINGSSVAQYAIKRIFQMNKT